MTIVTVWITLIVCGIIWWVLYFRAFQPKMIISGATIVLTPDEEELIERDDNLKMIWKEGVYLENEIARCMWYWNAFHRPASPLKAIWYRFFAQKQWNKIKERRREVWEEFSFVKKLVAEREDDEWTVENV